MRQVIGRRVTYKQLIGKDGQVSHGRKAVSQRDRAGETERPPLTAEQFEASPEFRVFKRAKRKVMKMLKSELDERVRRAKETSPRFGESKRAGAEAQQALLRNVMYIGIYWESWATI